MKFIIVLGGLSLDMLYALKLRSVGNNQSKYNSLSGILGTLFLRSEEMAVEMQHAMQCRGFTGEYALKKTYRFSHVDLIYGAINLALIFGYFYLKGFGV